MLYLSHINFYSKKSSTYLKYTSDFRQYLPKKIQFDELVYTYKIIDENVDKLQERNDSNISNNQNENKHYKCVWKVWIFCSLV